MTDESKENAIIDSWKTNAGAWSNAIADSKIKSRALITNRAVIETILEHKPGTVLDIGCGEGWLVRALSENAISACGADNNSMLIQQARSLGNQQYFELGYEDIVKGAITNKFDLIVCNFSLLGKESVETLLVAIPALLTPNGKLVVQTLHPQTACSNEPYSDGWREGSWEGFGEEFTDPAPWYFRTRESWIKLMAASGFSEIKTKEPIHPETNRPASLIIIGCGI